MRHPVLLVLSGLLAAAVVGVAAFVSHPRPLLQRALAASLGLDVTIEAAEISLGAVTIVTLAGLRVPNASWGSTADLVRVASLTAALDLAPLLRGEVRLRRATVDGFRLSLERDPNGRGNWKRPGPVAPAAVKTRPWLPTILDLAVRDSGLLLRTSGGALLHVDARRLTLRTEARDRPVGLDADIAYNDAPIALSAKLESFDAYRDAARRFGFGLVATTDAGRLELDGSADRPLDFDALEGELRADIPDIGRFVALFGSGLELRVPLQLAGRFSHDGDAWRLAKARGTLAGSVVTAELALDEGARLQSDTVRAAVELADLDLDRTLDRMGKAPGGGSGGMRISVDAHPGVLLDADIGIARLGWRDAGATGLRLRVEVAPGRMALSRFGLNLAGGRVSGAASVDAGEPAPGIVAHVEIVDAEARQLLRLAGIRTLTLGGKITGQAAAAAVGTTMAEAARGVVGQAVLTMGAGQISRELMLLASTDIRRLFGAASGTSPVSCLLAVMNVQAGVGTLTPLRIRSGVGTLFGGGVIDFNRETLDLTIKTARSSTDFFALDVPIRIDGPVDSPTVRPALDSDAQAIAGQGLFAVRRLPEGMRALAAASPCVR